MAEVFHPLCLPVPRDFRCLQVVCWYGLFPSPLTATSKNPVPLLTLVCGDCFRKLQQMSFDHEGEMSPLAAIQYKVDKTLAF